MVGAIAKVAQEEPKDELFDILVKSLTDVDVDVRCEEAAALGNLAYKPAIPNLIELLDPGDGETRRAETQSAESFLMAMGWEEKTAGKSIEDVFKVERKKGSRMS